MPRRSTLLAELHAHSTWSDGTFSIGELVDLYGRESFDVLAVTDHVVRADDPRRSPRCGSITAANYSAYLAELESEAERARLAYDLLLIPGLELTFDDPDPLRAAHAFAVGLRSFVGLDEGLDTALEQARDRGAALIGAHPYTSEEARAAPRGTARLAEEPDWAKAAVDRFELCNRHEFFTWVARAKVPVVANGDFHRLEHLATWKTLIPVAKDIDAVIEFLRGSGEALLTRFEPRAAATRLAA